MSDALFVSVEEAARRIGIGRTLAYELCRAFQDRGPTGCAACVLDDGCWCPCGPWRTRSRREATGPGAVAVAGVGARGRSGRGLGSLVLLTVRAAAVRRQVGPTGWVVLEAIAGSVRSSYRAESRGGQYSSPCANAGLVEGHGGEGVVASDRRGPGGASGCASVVAVRWFGVRGC